MNRNCTGKESNRALSFRFVDLQPKTMGFQHQWVATAASGSSSEG
jgi:hypothetical protein